MSKQSENKAAQGYTTEMRTCATCAHYKSEIAPPPWISEEKAKSPDVSCHTKYEIEHWGVEKKKRCGIGGFAVKKTATCNLYEAVK